VYCLLGEREGVLTMSSSLYLGILCTGIINKEGKSNILPSPRIFCYKKAINIDSLNEKKRRRKQQWRKRGRGRTKRIITFTKKANRSSSRCFRSFAIAFG
jgi:hypothetical protein